MLSLAAPGGLLLLRELRVPRPILAEISADWLTYIYVFCATAVVALIGFVLGRQADRLAALAETDVLTGLPNRRAFTGRLAEEFHRAERYGTPVSLLLVDIDGLKQVNDHEGHAAGDRMIRAVAGAIRGSLRESDFAARWGGDEFAIVTPNSGPGAAHQFANRLVARVAVESSPPRSPSSTVSVGVATFDPSTGHYDIDELVQAADDALYRAKEDGRNCARAAA